MNTTTKTLSAFAGLAIATGSASAALVGHWEFDNATDVGEATVSSDLEAVGDAAYSAAGKVGGALSLDGAGDYLRVNAGLDLAAGLPTGDASYTIAAFIQTTDVDRNTITFWGEITTAKANGFRTTTVNEGAIQNNSTGGILNWGFARDLGSGAGGTPPGDIYDGGWHHVAVTYNSATSTKTLYFDGVEIASGAIGDLNVSASGFVIGATRTGGEAFDGLIDDVRVYNTAESGATIAGLAAIPEPSSLALLGLGGLLVARRRRG